MIRKLTFLCVFLLLTSSAIFARQKTAKFLGTWKLAESENKWAEKLGIQSMTIVVTEENNDLIIERNSQKENSAETYGYKTTFRTTGATTTRLIGGQFGGVETRSLRFLKNDKMQFITTVLRDHDLNTVIGSTPNRETWTVSEDGKTLTVKTVNKYASAKMIFTKQ